ncbi:MAG: hypothetical protein ABIE25_00045 [Thermoplasmatota archaeon]|nr:hypothetical protein [Candidatus Thermoplasmatota archaeon]MBU1915450.1 hypothetical protein [Candidatus Thermoplasmatota archaeon]
MPYDLREGIALNGSSFFVLERSWSTDGAQEFPFGVVVVDSDRIIATLNDSSVFYVGGPAENHIVGFWTR